MASVPRSPVDQSEAAILKERVADLEAKEAELVEMNETLVGAIEAGQEAMVLAQSNAAPEGIIPAQEAQILQLEKQNKLLSSQLKQSKTVQKRQEGA